MGIRKWLIVVALMTSASSQALIVKLSALHTMARRSDIVIHGFIHGQRVIYDDRGRIITLTDVEVIDGLRGARAGDIISIYQVGGKKDGVVMPLLGGQLYNPGSQVFFFGLKLDDSFVSYGAGQGKLDLVSRNGHDTVIEDLGTVGVIATGSKELTSPVPLEFPDANLFKDEVKLMLDTP